MRIAILGAPGAGKSTQAELLAAQYRVPHIAIAQLLHPDPAPKKGAKSTQSKKGGAKKTKIKGSKSSKVGAAAARKHGGHGGHDESDAPVDDATILTLLEERLRARDSKRGFIIDGFPNNIPQAQALDSLLSRLGWGLQIILHATADDGILVKHLLGRMQCQKCKAIYNRHQMPTQSRNKCDECGGKVLAATTVTAKIAAADVAEYNDQTAPLLAYYKAQHKLRTVSVDGLAEQIRQKICDIVDLEIRPLEIKTLETAAQSVDEEVNTIIAGGQISRITANEPPPQSLKGGAKRAAPASKVAAAKKVAKKVAPKSTRQTAAKKIAKKSAKKATAKKR